MWRDVSEAQGLIVYSMQPMLVRDSMMKGTPTLTVSNQGYVSGRYSFFKEKNMVRKQNGFTLIEVVMIIVIIGILAAVAIPRFIALRADARAAAVKGMYNAVKSVSAMTHVAYLAHDSGPIAVKGAKVTIVNGYPAAAEADGIENAVQFDAADFTYTKGAPARFAHAGVGSPANCAVFYKEAAAGGMPIITMDVSDCN